MLDRVHLGKFLNIPYINDKLNNVGLSEKELKNLSYHQCHLLNNNPVLVARHFQYEVEEITLDGPLGKILCYTYFNFKTGVVYLSIILFGFSIPQIFKMK